MEANEEMLATLVPLVTSYGLRIVGVLFALWASFRIAGWLQNRVTRGLRQRSFDETLSIFFGNLLRWLVLVAAVLACLGVFGIETTSFAAIIGAASLAVGLAFQGTLSNFAAGVMLLVFRPFKVGDYIVAGGKEGKVAEIGLFVTALDTVDNRRIFLPNTAIGSGAIENNTAHPVRRIDIDREQWEKFLVRVRQTVFFWKGVPRPAQADVSLAALLARRDQVRSEQTVAPAEARPELFKPAQSVILPNPAASRSAPDSAKVPQEERPPQSGEAKPETTASRLLVGGSMTAAACQSRSWDGRRR